MKNCKCKTRDFKDLGDLLVIMLGDAGHWFHNSLVPYFTGHWLYKEISMDTKHQMAHLNIKMASISDAVIPNDEFWKLYSPYFSKKYQGPVSIERRSFPGMGIPMLKIRRSRDRLIFNMGIPIPVRRNLYNETAPRVGVVHQSIKRYIRTDSSQWEMVLLCNDISHWLGANLESALVLEYRQRHNLKH